MALTKQEVIERVLSEQQCTKISIKVGEKRRQLVLDYQTAARLKKVFDSAGCPGDLSSLSWDRLVSLAWRV